MRVVKVLALIACVGMLAGCMGWPIYMDRTAKPNLNAASDTRYEVTNYAVLGPVTAEVESLCVLGVYVRGEDGQGCLMRAALQKYNNCTGIKHVCAVKTYEGILPPVYCKIQTTYMGVAVTDK